MEATGITKAVAPSIDKQKLGRLYWLIKMEVGANKLEIKNSYDLKG